MFKKKFHEKLLKFIEYKNYIRIKYFFLGFIIATLANVVVILAITNNQVEQQKEVGVINTNTSGQVAKTISTRGKCNPDQMWCTSLNKCINAHTEDCPVEQKTSKSEGTEVDKAKSVAEEYILKLSDYRERSGRSIRVLRAKKSICYGCWTVLAQYDYPSEVKDHIDRVKLELVMNNYKVIDVYESSNLTVLKEAECLEQGARLENFSIGCGLTADEFYLGDVEGKSPKICCLPVELLNN